MQKRNTKDYLTIKDLPSYETNPFLDKAVKEIDEHSVVKRRFVRGNKGVEQLNVVDGDGEIRAQTMLHEVLHYDNDQFVKFYLSQFTAFWDLPKPAYRVFSYILQDCLGPNKDRFIFFIDDALKHTGYSSNKYINSGLAALINAGIIARSNRKMEYFINPLVVFNGDRFTIAKTYVRRKPKSKAIDPNQTTISFDNPEEKFEQDKSNDNIQG